MKGLNFKSIKSLEQTIRSKFDRLTMQFLGLVPQQSDKKTIVLKTTKESLISLFLKALGTKNPNKIEEQTLKTILSVSNNYLNSLKERTTARIVNSVDSYVRDSNIKQIKIKASDVSKIIETEMDKAGNNFKLIANAELNKTINIGTALQISKIAEEQGVKDPTVFFIVTIDERNDPETYRLHLLPDRLTPRVYKLSELGHGYHKKGDEWPKLGGTNPNCRCFYDGNYTVITESSGQKKISEVNIGDKVLTHTGKFKKVTGTFGRKGLPSNGSIGKGISFKTPQGGVRSLRVTDDHLFMTQNGWKSAKNITTTDKFYFLFKECEHCKTPFPHDTIKPNRRFCKKKCSTDSNKGKKGWAKGTTRDPEVVRKNAIKATATRLKKTEHKRISGLEAICKYCKKAFQYDSFYKSKKGRYVYKKTPPTSCSRSCHSKHISTKQWADKNHRKNISSKNRESMLLQYKNGDRSPGIVEKARKALLKNGKISKQQTAVYEIIKKEYPEAIMEMKIGSFFADIAIPSIKVIIEWDGGGHWISVYKGEKTMEQKQNEDNQRDIYMEGEGWHVVRLNDSTGYKNVLSDIRRAALNSTGGYSFKEVEIVQIKNLDSYHFKKEARLYDITVEEDHSFVVSGVVSHNCKLSYLPESFGFDKSGKIKYIGQNHDEFKSQREKYGLPSVPAKISRKKPK